MATNHQQIQAVFARYFAAGSLKDALKQERVNVSDFYDWLASNPSDETRYRDIQKARADILVSEAIDLGAGEFTNEVQISAARLRTQLRIKIAGFYDRRRYGEKVTHEIEAGPDLLAALDAARARALPNRDLAQTIDAEFVAITAQDAQVTTDETSVFEDAAIETPDVFGD